MGTSGYRVPIPESTPPTTGSPDGDALNRALARTSQHDLELGLGRGGSIRSAVEEAARSNAGMLGVALFDVTLDKGWTIRVDLVQTSAVAKLWDSLRDSIARLVAAKSGRLPEPWRGLRVRVQVEATESSRTDGPPGPLAPACMLRSARLAPRASR
jgi:hypothetical protein